MHDTYLCTHDIIQLIVTKYNVIDIYINLRPTEKNPY